MNTKLNTVLKTLNKTMTLEGSSIRTVNFLYRPDTRQVYYTPANGDPLLLSEKILNENPGLRMSLLSEFQPYLIESKNRTPVEIQELDVDLDRINQDISRIREIAKQFGYRLTLTRAGYFKVVIDPDSLSRVQVQVSASTVEAVVKENPPEP